MSRSIRRPLVAVALLALAAAAPAMAQAPPPGQVPSDTTTNLKVLPAGTPRHEVVRVMGGFTRALGVRCAYCHVDREGAAPDFALDDKPTKLKAREMMKMVNDLNSKYLAALDHRADPPIKVECATCHHGVAQPRPLQDVLKMAYDTGGMDSTLARYHALRDRYYGRAAYDFGDVPLADLAGQLSAGGHPADALQLLSFNVDVNPTSPFAKRQYATAAIAAAFAAPGDSGAAVYRRMKATYGPAVNDFTLADVARQLQGAGDTDAAFAALTLDASEHPASANAQIAVGDAYAARGDRKQALAAYTRALTLDRGQAVAQQRIDALRATKATKPSKRR